MTVEGPRKGEPSRKTVRHGLRTQPANSVRGSSRRIMSMRFRPAHISVINRRDSATAVIGPVVQQKHSEPTSRMCSRPSRPSQSHGNARTVLAGKGSLRRAQPRRALARCAPFRPDPYAMGGSGGNTGDPYQSKTPGLTRCLTGSLHISFPTACVPRDRLRSRRAAPCGSRVSTPLPAWRTPTIRRHRRSPGVAPPVGEKPLR